MARVYGIHRLTLKPGADAAEFERFAAEELTPKLRDALPGARWRLLRGYKGDREGKYLTLFEFDSVEQLESYFPVHQGEPSQEWENAMAAVGAELERASEFLVAISDPANTDYVVVAE